MIDIVPAILEVGAGIGNGVGIAQKPMEGVSMAYTLTRPCRRAQHARRSTSNHRQQAIYHDGWIAATTPPSPPG
jgi:arylsulfatase